MVIFSLYFFFQGLSDALEVAKAASQISDLDARIFFVKHMLEIREDPKEALGTLNDLQKQSEKVEMSERILTWAELLFK